MDRFKLLRTLVASAVFLGFGLQASPTEAAQSPAAAPVAPDHIPAYVARFGRDRPVVAVVGHNAGTELTDFVIPYAVLQRSGAVEAVTVATEPGVGSPGTELEFAL